MTTSWSRSTKLLISIAVTWVCAEGSEATYPPFKHLDCVFDAKVALAKDSMLPIQSNASFTPMRGLHPSSCRLPGHNDLLIVASPGSSRNRGCPQLFNVASIAATEFSLCQSTRHPVSWRTLQARQTPTPCRRSAQPGRRTGAGIRNADALCSGAWSRRK